MVNPNDTEDGCAADIDSDMEQGNGIEDPECPAHRDVSAAPNIPKWIWPTHTSQRQTEKVLVTVRPIETRRNNRVKKK